MMSGDVGSGGWFWRTVDCNIMAAFIFVLCTPYNIAYINFHAKQLNFQVAMRMFLKSCLVNLNQLTLYCLLMIYGWIGLWSKNRHR